MSEPDRTAPPRPRVTKRYASDAWIAAVALGLAMVASVFRATTLTDFERDVFEAINHLSDVLSTPVQAIMLLGTFVAIPVVTIVAIIFRRYRLASVLVASGCLAYEH